MVACLQHSPQLVRSPCLRHTLHSNLDFSHIEIRAADLPLDSEAVQSISSFPIAAYAYVLLLVLQLLDAKQRYASEMDLVKDKLQVVLAKKDGVIAGLRQELQDVSTRLAQAEQLMLDLGTDN